MGMQWVHMPGQQPDTGGSVVVDRHWYLTEDRSRVVVEGDPAGRWLWASPGTEVSRADAVRLGAVASEPDDTPEVASVATVKAQSAPPNKQQSKPADKAEATIEDLRQRAMDLGVSVDNRWGTARLQQEIASAEKKG